MNQGSPEERYRQALRLDSLGLAEEARIELGELLREDPAPIGAKTLYENMLYRTGPRTAHRTLYREDPYPPAWDTDETEIPGNARAEDTGSEQARLILEAALQLDPLDRTANRGMAYLLSDAGDELKAKEFRDRAFRQIPVRFQQDGEEKKVKVLLLVSTLGGLAPLRRHLDSLPFHLTNLYVETFDPKLPLPPHQKVINLIGDADRCPQALEIASRLLKKTSASVLNPPDKVLPTGREEISNKLSAIPGILTPRISLLPRERLMRPQAGSDLAELGFTFPFLLRSPGFHGGKHFIYVENEESLRNQLPALPGEHLFVIQYLDSRSPDGKIRKYRVMMIEGKLYPLHAAVSHDWKIHYFSAEMAENPENRREDLDFLERMPEVLGPKAMSVLGKVCSTLGLDYGGIDFGLNGNGDILLYETNATMVVYPPERDHRWDYRRPAVRKVLEAIQRMLLKG